MKVILCVAVFALFAVSALALTDCQEHRERELKSNTKVKSLVKLVPKCDENGDYETLQCFEGSPFCMCWRKDGTHITDPSMKIKTCACHAHRDRELSKIKRGMVGVFVPACEEKGTYSRMQCHGSIGMCWCSDEKGNRIGEGKRGKIDC